MKVPQETYEEMLLRAYRASPGTCAAIIERAAAVYRKTVREVSEDYRMKFGGHAGH